KLSVPPAQPSGVKVSSLSPDRTVTVSWAANKEPDLSDYLVFRAVADSAGGRRRAVLLRPGRTARRRRQHAGLALLGGRKVGQGGGAARRVHDDEHHRRRHRLAARDGGVEWGRLGVGRGDQPA